jgi:tetratricopeptide (TPR) repeat protein
MGRSYVNEGDLAKVAEIAGEIMALSPTAGNAALCYAHSLSGAENYLQGKWGKAAASIEAALAYLGNASETLGHVVLRFLLAQVLVEQRKLEAARTQFAQLRRLAERSGNDAVLHHCLLGEAEAALAAGDETTALCLLRQGLSLGREANLQYFATWRPAALGRLLALALEHGVEEETVKDIIRARRLTPLDGVRTLGAWPLPLHIHTLGDFSIYRNGERLHFLGKAPRRPLDLLKVLIAFGGRGVGVERLQDTLWPDAEGDSAQRSFEITLHRLRKLLGVEGALIVAEKRLTLSSAHCWVDLWALEALMREADVIVAGAAPSESDDRLEALTRRLLDVYRGGFLHGLLEASWATKVEVRLASRMAHLCRELERLWHRRGRHDLAAACDNKVRDI